MNRTARNSPAIALRITDPSLHDRVESLAKEQGLSLNMTVLLLLGYAFNQIDATGKKFKAVMVFDSEKSNV